MVSLYNTIVSQRDIFVNDEYIDMGFVCGIIFDFITIYAYHKQWHGVPRLGMADIRLDCERI